MNNNNSEDNKRNIDKPDMQKLKSMSKLAAINPHTVKMNAALCRLGHDATLEQVTSELLHFKEKRYTPLIVVGPSGAGKGTLIGALNAKHPGKFGFSVSCTTRKPREGEENGVHYHFLEMEDFKAKIAAGEFVEYCEVHGNMYGTAF